MKVEEGKEEMNDDGGKKKNNLACKIVDYKKI